MSATQGIPSTQIPTTPGEIPPRLACLDGFPDEPQTQANLGQQDGEQKGGQEGGGLVETAKSFLPGEDDVQRALTNAGQAAKGWLPTSVAAYFPSSEEPPTTTSDPPAASEANTTSALSTLADAGALDSAASESTTLSTQSHPTANSDNINTGGSDSPHPVPPLALGASESRFIEALPSPPISIPMSESPAPVSFVAPSVATTGSADVVPPTMAKTGSAALNSSRPEDTFPSDTPASFIAATSSSSPLPTPVPPPPPKDSDTAGSKPGAAPPVPVKDSTAPPMKESMPPTSTPDSHSQSFGDDSGSGEENTEDGASGSGGGGKKKKKKKGKLIQRLKEKLHVGHSHSHEHDSEAS